MSSPSLTDTALSSAAPPPPRSSWADADVFRSADPTHPTGYEGVYVHTDIASQVKYQAKAFKRSVGPVRETPRAAASDLAGWWRAEFGPRWREFWLGRLSKPVRYLPQPGGGWRVLVFVRGVPEYVGRGQLGATFPDRAAAGAAARRWVRERLGVFWPARHLILRCGARAARRTG